jgi:S-DNA-T family DNA segregation ATPase FtsK/SpoIIIE
MASWMQGNEDYRKSVESALTDLASKSRAAGIHIILVTQRASQEAIPPSVRENMGNRLCLKVASDKGSNLALGASGAESLLGKGHLAAGLPGDTPPGSEFYIVQVPFISEDDLARLGEVIGKG